MGKKRMIDMDGLCFDIEITELGIDACFFYVRLWSLAEDWGGIEIEPRGIQLHMGGLQQEFELERIRGLLQDFVSMDKIVLYEIDGKTYGWLKNFIKHQKLNLPAPSKLPLPEWVKWHPKTGENKSQKYEFLEVPNDRITTVQIGKNKPNEKKQTTTVERPYNKKNRIEENRKEKNKDSCHEPLEAGSSTPAKEDDNSDSKIIKIVFNYSTLKLAGVTPDDITSWKEAYPNVDILQEIKQIEQWCIANRSKISLRQGKGKPGLRRTLVSWFNRAEKQYEASLNLQKAKREAKGEFAGIVYTDWGAYQRAKQEGKENIRFEGKRPNV